MDDATLERLLANATPGPWSICIDDDGNPLSGRPSVQASAELDCAIVHWDGFIQEYWRSARGDMEIHANARLIALAPDLAAEVLRLRAATKGLADAAGDVLAFRPAQTRQHKTRCGCVDCTLRAALAAFNATQEGV